jgi:hypothetical protein
VEAGMEARTTPAAPFGKEIASIDSTINTAAGNFAAANDLFSVLKPQRY